MLWTLQCLQGLTVVALCVGTIAGVSQLVGGSYVEVGLSAMVVAASIYCHRLVTEKIAWKRAIQTIAQLANVMKTLNAHLSAMRWLSPTCQCHRCIAARN